MLDTIAGVVGVLAASALPLDTVSPTVHHDTVAIQAASAVPSDTAAPIVNNIDTVVVTARRRAASDAMNEEIVPSLGATKRTLNRDQIEVQSQGDNASFDQTLYRFPGVVQDELDKRLHVRGEEANLQYRINDVLLPDGLLGFGQELSPKFVDQLSLIVGTLPAQYGGRTAGIIDIRTKSGAGMNGGDLSFYGGSNGMLNPVFEYGNTVGKLTYYFNGCILNDDIGMANPTSSISPLHDTTTQYKGMVSLSYFIDTTSRLSLIVSGARSNFQLPNTPGQMTAYTYGADSSFESSTLNENQNEKNYYEVLAYQKKNGRLNFQVTQSARYNDVLFLPDTKGDLMFNGVAARAEHSLIANSLSGDAKFELNDRHTLRGGVCFTVESAKVNTSNGVFPAIWSDSLASWLQTSSTPYTVVDDNSKLAYLYSCYLQDEWKVMKGLTINYGLRFDGLNAYLDEYQLSPRINAVYRPCRKTAFHIGYARYFTPPPIEFVPTTSIAKFNNTTYGANPYNNQSSPVKSERYHYFDAGITHQVFPQLQIAIDGYYKIKQYVLDEGQFGPAMIFSPNNADHGYVRGVELTLNYEKGGFSAYGNLAFSRAMAYGLISGQFQFDIDELAYLQTHWYHLDHDQDITASVGAAFKVANVKVYTDALYGSGLYSGFGNAQELPQYVTVNPGIEYTLKVSRGNALKARFDVVNVLDKVYEIRDGDGIGVFAPQYIPRRGFYGGMSWEF
jgi:outer membrane receptor for ferrienterochelin and colicin